MITYNAIKCVHCGEVIESRHRHDYVTCKCGKVSVDGGKSYLKRCYDKVSDYIDLSVVVSGKEDETIY